MAKKLTKRDALRFAQNKYGARAFVRDSRTGTADERAEASRLLKCCREEEPTMTPMSEWPRETPLGEYVDALQQWKAAYKAWRTRRDALTSRAFCYRFAVGQINYGVAMTYGQGDTWEEALDRVGIARP